MKKETALKSEFSFFKEKRPIGFLITTVAASFEKEFLQRLTDEKMLSTISSADHSVLRCIAFSEFSSVEIARKLGLSKQAIGKTVTSLEKRGFIFRKESKSDRRKYILLMTDKGKNLITKSIQVANELETFTVDALGMTKLNSLKSLLGEIQKAQNDFVKNDQV